MDLNLSDLIMGVYNNTHAVFYKFFKASIDGVYEFTSILIPGEYNFKAYLNLVPSEGKDYITRTRYDNGSLISNTNFNHYEKTLDRWLCNNKFQTGPYH